MIIVMKPDASQANVEHIIAIIKGSGLAPHLSKGAEVTIIGVVGDKSRLDCANLEIAPGVDRLVPVTESYKLSNKKLHPQPTRITVGDLAIGPESLTIVAGPCAIESEEQLLQIARAVRKSGAHILRGGAYKPRTSPYSFQGLEEEGLKYMKLASQETGLATICEITSLEAINAAARYVDLLQIGARNMQNFQLLKEVGQTRLPVVLKRGLSATIDEWLNAAEYIIAEGNPNVILCERGIRTFETATRNTLDISAVPVLKAKTHLPVFVDPSHACGVRSYVAPLARAAVACGVDGLMIEVHNNPEKALSDGPQSLTCQQFDQLARELEPFAKLAGRTAAYPS